MSRVVQFTFSYTEEEYCEAIRQHYFPPIRGRILFTFLFLIFFLGIFNAVVSEDAWFLSALFITISLIGASLYAINYINLPKKFYAHNPLLREEYYLRFSDEGILFRAKDIESNLRWSLYKSVSETKRFYILSYGKDTFTVIPKRVFTSQEQEKLFRSLLKTHIDSTLKFEETENDHEPKFLEPPDWR